MDAIAFEECLDTAGGVITADGCFDAAVTKLCCRDVHATEDVVSSSNKRRRCRLLDWSNGFQKRSS